MAYGTYQTYDPTAYARTRPPSGSGGGMTIDDIIASIQGNAGSTGSGDVYAASTRVDRGNDPGYDAARRHGARRAERRANRAERRANRADNRALGNRHERRVAAGGAGDPNLYPGNAKKAARQRALDTILSILQSQGHTDPALMNTQLTDISRSGEANTNSLDEYLASQGLSGSGVGVATRAAIGQNTGAQRSEAIARENALAEERRRADLELVLGHVLNPRLQRRAQDKMLEASRQKGGSNLGALGNILGALGQAGSSTDWSNMGGGNGNTNDPYADSPYGGTAENGYTDYPANDNYGGGYY